MCYLQNINKLIKHSNTTQLKTFRESDITPKFINRVLNLQRNMRPFLSLLSALFHLIVIKDCHCDKLNYSDIRFDLLISKVPYFCHIKLCTTFLDSHNLQESLIPFENIIPKNVPIVYEKYKTYPKVYRFPPSRLIRSNCRVNFLYSKVLNGRVFNRTETILYLDSITNLRYDKKNRHEDSLIFLKSYNIILTNKFNASSYPGWDFLHNRFHIFSNAQYYALLGFISTKPVFCTIPTLKRDMSFDKDTKLERIFDSQRDCKIIHNIYDYIPWTNWDDIASWEHSMDTYFSVQSEKQNKYAILSTDQWYMGNSLNPFKSKRVAQTIAEMLVKISNGTLLVYKSEGYITDKHSAGIISIEYEAKEVMADSVQTKFDFVKMFTCYEQPKLSFVMYVSPFDTEIWVFILCTGIITCILFGFFRKTINLVSHDKSFSFGLFVIGALIEEAYIFPSQLRRFLTFKVLFFPWAVCSMLLSACYNSVLVANLNSPLKSQSINSTDQVFCPLPENLHASSPQETVEFLANIWANVSGLIFEKGQRLSMFQQRLHGLEIQKYYLNFEQAKDCFAVLMISSPDRLLGNFTQAWSEHDDVYALLEKFDFKFFNERSFHRRGNSSSFKQKFKQFLKIFFSFKSTFLPLGRRELYLQFIT